MARHELFQKYGFRISQRGPESWPRVDGDVRRILVRPFPYALEADTLVVLAVAHAKRRPGYWADRIEAPDEDT